MQQNEKPTIIGVGIALGTDKTAFARSNACPLQIYDGGEWFCGKITDVRVACPEMTDFKACGNYPYKKRKEIYNELARTGGGNTCGGAINDPRPQPRLQYELP